MSFIKIQLTFDITLYEGRLEKPYEDSLWDLWFHDEFLGFAINDQYLRPGESITLTSIKEIKDGG